jgi:hypothetical protein
MGQLTLRDALASIDDFDDEATIYAAKPWDPTSTTVIAAEGEETANTAIGEGLAYFLEVSIAKEAIEVWSEWRGGRVPSADERCEAVIHYAVNDAYLQP